MKRILITGASGFLGSSVVNQFDSSISPFDIQTFRSSEYDLRSKNAVRDLLNDKKPDYIVHLAAVVGGIGANMDAPGQFFYDNMSMGLHFIEESRLFGIERFLMTGTICSYPKFTPVPFHESEIWNGYPEETNAPYGIAKKALMVQLDAYRKQYNFNSTVLMLVNLYGPRDNFDLHTGHVIPAMLRKFHEAKILGRDSVTLWGDGSPSREFLFVN